MMTITPQLLDAFRYFRAESNAATILIRIGNEYAVCSKGPNGKDSISSIPVDKLGWAMWNYGPAHSIAIISQRNSAGEFDIPDIQRMETEKCLDY